MRENSDERLNVVHFLSGQDAEIVALLLGQFAELLDRPVGDVFLSEQFAVLFNELGSEVGQLHEWVFSLPETLSETLTELEQSLDVLSSDLLATNLLLEQLVQLDGNVDHALKMQGH